MTDENTQDAYKPAKIAVLVEDLGVTKAQLPILQMFVLAILAGAFIGFGAAAYTTVMTGVDGTYGPARMLGGVVFSLGLFLVIIGGAELFTGNALMVMAAVDQKITIRQLLRSWAVVYAGNLVGAAGLAVAFGLSGLLDGPVGVTAATIPEAKATLLPFEAFVRGALCNALVCLAIWLSFAARTAAGKILAILWPITAFVILGLEHSVANMYFFPQGWMAGSGVMLGDAMANLIWVTLGNVVGARVASRWHIVLRTLVSPRADGSVCSLILTMVMNDCDRAKHDKMLAAVTGSLCVSSPIKWSDRFGHLASMFYKIDQT